MAGRRRKKAEKKLDRVLTSKLYLEGKSVRAIAAAINAQRPYSISYSTVSLDIKKIVAEWREESFKNIDDKMAIELNKLNRLESEAWQQHFKSSEVTTKSTLKIGDKSGTTKITQNIENRADPRWMEIVLRCIDKRCKLLGLDTSDQEQIELNQTIKVTLPPPPPPKEEQVHE